jgi:hypothetical protein
VSPLSLLFTHGNLLIYVFLNFVSLVRMHPKVGETLNGMGSLCMAQGKWEEAEAHFRRALAICVAVVGKRVLFDF